MAVSALKQDGRAPAIILNKIIYHLSRHWLLTLTILLALFVGLPWLAPVFMESGWTRAGEAIYLIYSTQCHQLPQRSFFLFGEDPMLSFAAIQTLWSNTNDPVVLRQFIGQADVGWKVAWSDRMVYMYTSLLLSGIAFWPLRKRLKPLPVWGLFLFLFPMALDGTTHIISDITGGIGGGFRFTNDWLAALTGNSFPATFYIGDALGSFNSWMRLISGVIFGIGVVWCIYPRLHIAFNDTANQIAAKLRWREEKMGAGNEKLSKDSILQVQ
jgi:uncharacterized membrane protein